jgi:4-hydroxy-tetrahydrodipicolinate synthase/2-dehydro-3-deoxy-phosphogluconate/2-dehydro-3-deoxy-6-phosphogalactonate aldolase
MGKNVPIQGILPALLTPYDASGNVNLEEIKKHLDFLIERGVNGIFALGTNGEFLLLTPDEKRKVIQTVVEHVHGRVPVVVGVGSPGTRETIELARFAANAGADALSVITPFYYPWRREGILAHYLNIAEAVDHPLFIYHIPHLSGSKLTVELLAELAEIPQIQGIKDSSRDLTWFYRAVEAVPRWTFLMGTDALIYPSLLLGAKGAVSAIANAFPELLVSLYNAVVEDDLKRAKGMQDKVLQIRAIFEQFPYLAGIKAAAELRGLAGGAPRLPLIGLNEGDRADLQARLKPFLLEVGRGVQG